jgi:helix-turn-helix protein
VFEIGNTLREARTRQQLELHDAEQATKVRAKYLRALEEEHFDSLPSQTYVKGFMRTYADYLGLDGQLFVDEYNSRFLVPAAESDVQLRPRRSRARPRREPRVERNAILIALVGIGVVVALVFAAWKFGGSSQPTVPNLKQGRPTSTPAAHAQPAATTSKLLIRALPSVGGRKRTTLLEVRLGSAEGRAVFQGTITNGQRQVFRARQLWVSIGSPENVVFQLNGRTLHVGGTRPCVVVVTRQVVPAGRGTC